MNFHSFSFFYLFINLLYLIINENDLYIRSIDLDYTHAITLLNGNVFIIHKNGVRVYNYNFSIILYDFDFGGNQLISSELENNLTSIMQCDDDNNKYVTALLYNNIYIFSSKGKYLFDKPHTLFAKFPVNANYNFYSFLFYKSEDSIYYYIVTFISNDNHITIIFFKINMNNQEYEVILEKNYEINNPISDSCSCQIIYNYNSTNILSCFYLISSTNEFNQNINVISLSIFDIEKDFDNINYTSIYSITETPQRYIIKSIKGEYEKKLYVQMLSTERNQALWFIFDFELFKINDPYNLFGITCFKGTNLINIQYFQYNNHYLFSCNETDGIAIQFRKFNQDNTISESQNNKITYLSCVSYINYDIIFLPFKGDYIAITNFICDGNMNTQLYDFPYGLTNYEIMPGEPDSEEFFSNYTEKSIPNAIPEPTTNGIPESIKNTIPESIPISIPETIPIIISKYYNPSSTLLENDYQCQLKCLKCNEYSIILDLCIECNSEKGFYPSLALGMSYYECYNEETKPSNYFFNKITKYYEPCFSKCKTCAYQGNDEINNCTSCRNNYIFLPDEKDTTNCVLKCDYYYYILFNIYYCTDNNQCPSDVPLLVRNKGKCIDNCYNDNEYKYRFNYECYIECPEDTTKDGDFICRLKNKKKCYLYNDFLSNINYNDLEYNHFDTFIKRYIYGFNDTDFHIDFYQSKNYTITIYKTMECLKELEMISTIIDFRECYEKVQNKYNFVGRNLIILIADFFNDKKLENTLFYFFDPDTGDELPINEICKDVEITIEKSLTYYPEINIENAKFFENQDINIFNTSDIFYNDLCYSFESPNGKDVPLKERILLFYPNVTLCENNCNNVGVNLTTMKAICQCKMNQLINGAKDASKLVGLDIPDLIDSLSIDVMKCYKTLFKAKYFIKCYGGFICLFLIIAQTIFTAFAIKISMYKIRKNTFSLLERYSSLIHSKYEVQFPPKKSSLNNNNNNMNLNSETKYKNSSMSIKNFLKSPTEDYKEKKDKNKLNHLKDRGKSMKYNDINKSINASNFQLNDELNIQEYLKTSMDELDYDELIEKDNRTFFKIFIDKLKVSQIFIDLIFNNNWIIPRTIKFIFLIVKIDLYMAVNALFYNQDYITNLYYLNEDKNIFSFVPRSLNRIIYTSVASGILDFIISLLFPPENKIKKILMRKRNSFKEKKNKALVSMKNIINNYRIFFVISYILTVISWYFISCFNNVYPYLKIEWIKSSIFIIIIMQILPIFTSFIFAILRIISIKCKSERIYRLSNYFFG